MISVKHFFLVAISIPAITLSGALNLELQVKECAKVGSPSGFPVQVVVPLPSGTYSDVNSFRVTDESGNTVPAQFNVMTRNWIKDWSLENITVNFQPSVAAFSSAGTGITKYYLKDDGTGNSASTSLQVVNASDKITVTTGTIRFVVSKTAFNIIDELWFDRDNNGSYSSEEKIIQSSTQHGGVFTGRLSGDVQYDASRSDVSVVVEESGPMRVVIKAEALTKYYSTVEHTHGFAVRIYAYAGKPYVKIDYQLQNSAKNKVVAWPLYFDNMKVNFALNLGLNPTVRMGLENGTAFERSCNKGLLLAQDSSNRFKIKDLASGDSLSGGVKAPGYMDIRDGSIGVAAVTRYFQQMWPNGLSIDSTNKLQIQLWPEWSSSWFNCCGLPDFGATTESYWQKLYWLEDMQHVYKEILLAFHDGTMTSSNLNALAKTFEYPPVVSLPTAWYYDSKATLDYGGVIPVTTKYATTDTARKPSGYKRMGWDWFSYGSGARRWAPAQAGGLPDGMGDFVVTENPLDYYEAQEYALEEMNTKPHSMAQYTYANDYPFLRLGANLPHNRNLSYQSNLWRRQLSGGSHLDTSYLKGTEQDARPRDQEHMWYYHVADAYFLSGNPWIKDWYQFYGEYLKNTVACSVEECGATSYRDQGHEGTNAMNAYRVTGDTTGLNMMSYFWLHRYGGSFDRVTGVGYFKPWMVGFGLRGVCTYLEAVKGNPARWQNFVEIFKVLASQMEYNYQYGSFAYEGYPNMVNASYNGSMSLVDPFAWYYYHSGTKRYWNFLEEFLENGINGGSGLSIPDWKGKWGGRYYDFVKKNPKSDTIAPSPINNLTMTRNGDSCVVFWTAPSGAKRYMMLYDSRFISEEYTADTMQMNWWAAGVVGPSFTATPGATERLAFKAPATGNLCVAVYSFDSAYNISALSNRALSDATPPSTPSGLQTILVTANRIELSWNQSLDPETGVRYYSVYRDGALLATVTTPSFVDSTVFGLTTYTYSIVATNQFFMGSAKSADYPVTTSPDITPPELIKVFAVADSSTILLTFNEVIDSSVMTDLSNYSVNDGVSILSVKLADDRRAVTLSVSGMQSNKTFAITIKKIQDVAAAPNITGEIIREFTFIEILQISNATIDGGTVTWDILDKDKFIYIDRTATIDSLGDKYRGLTYIRVYDGNSAKTSPSYISFKVNKPCTVLVAHEDPCNNVPSWLSSSFTYTGDTIRGKWSTSFSNYRVYAKACTAGTVKLGGQGGSSNCATYWVIIKGHTSLSLPAVLPVANMEEDFIAAIPNPFNPVVNISARITSVGKNSGIVKLKIFDIKGALAASLSAPVIQGGSGSNVPVHRWCWDASNVPSGTYVARVTAGGKSLTKKILLVR
jgi:hypothetical protein